MRHADLTPFRTVWVNDDEAKKREVVVHNDRELAKRIVLAELMEQVLQRVRIENNNNQNPEPVNPAEQNNPVNQENEPVAEPRNPQFPAEANQIDNNDKSDEKSEKSFANNQLENKISEVQGIVNNPHLKKEDVASALEQLNTFANTQPNTPKKNAWEKNKEKNEKVIVDLIEKQEVTVAKKSSIETIKRILQEQSINFADLVIKEVKNDNWHEYLENLNTSQAVAAFVQQIQQAAQQKNQLINQKIKVNDISSENSKNKPWLITGIILVPAGIISLITYSLWKNKKNK